MPPMPFLVPERLPGGESKSSSKSAKEREKMPLSRDLKEFVGCLTSNKAE